MSTCAWATAVPSNRTVNVCANAAHSERWGTRTSGEKRPAWLWIVASEDKPAPAAGQVNSPVILVNSPPSMVRSAGAAARRQMHGDRRALCESQGAAKMLTSDTLLNVVAVLPWPTYRTHRAGTSSTSYVSSAVVVPLFWPLHTVVHTPDTVETWRSKLFRRELPL